MKYTTLPNTDIKLSSVTLGCMTFTGDANWGPQEEKDSIETVRAAIDAGIVSFDTAEAYADGLSDIILGKALGADRSKVSVFSKLDTRKMTAKDVIPSCEAGLKRLNTDYLDLYQIHWPSATIPLEETMEQLLKLKEQGKIRAIGVSNFGVEDLGNAINKYADVVSNQIAYNMLFRGAEYSLLPLCIEKNIGVLTYSSLAQGLLSGKYLTAEDFPVGRARTKIFNSKIRTGANHGTEGCEEIAFKAIDDVRNICKEIGEEMADVALAWSLAQPGITSVIAGGRTPQQALTNAKGGNLELTPDVIKALSDATTPVKEFIGDDVDPWAYGRIK